VQGRWENIFEFSGGGDHYEKQPAGLFLKGIKARVSVAGFIKYFPNGLAHPLIGVLFRANETITKSSPQGCS